MPDNNDTTTNSSVTKPTWNTSPNTLPGFVLDLQKYLPKRDARYKALVEYGYILERRSVICVSDNHIDRVRQQLRGCDIIIGTPSVRVVVVLIYEALRSSF